MQALVGEAKAEGLPEQRACQVLRISPRSLQRWRRPAQPKAPAAPRPRPANALTRTEAATVVSLIRSAEHADQSCRELALSLKNGSETVLSVSPVTVWRYQCQHRVKKGSFGILMKAQDELCMASSGRGGATLPWNYLPAFWLIPLPAW